MNIGRSQGDVEPNGSAVSAEFRVYVEGPALWTPAWPGWAQAVAAHRSGHDAVVPADAPRRPSPALLAANERRRAPDSVLLALEVAAAACVSSGRSAADLPSVFTSAHGDLATTDALCRTLSGDPLLLSPTRFHHSVHNAASGYWAMASGSHAPSTALSAHTYSFAAGLLEAASQCVCAQGPVLLVAYDTEAVGALASVNRSRGLLALALVLASAPSASTWCAMRGSVQAGVATSPPAASGWGHALRHNAMAAGLPLFEALASMSKPQGDDTDGAPAAAPVSAVSTQCALPLGPDLQLLLSLTPMRGLPPAASLQP